MKKIIIFASGSGSNAEKIIVHFKKKTFARVVAVFCNNKKARVIEKTEKLAVPVILFTKEEFLSGRVLERLNEFKSDLIVLAGFLLKIPKTIISAYPNKIINIHPSLLPKYGGEGMYGMNVHKAVVENGEKETGITIHYINEEYDQGDILFQKKIIILSDYTPEEVALRIHQLEYAFFSKTIEKLLKGEIF